MSNTEILTKLMKIVNEEINVLGNIKGYVSDKNLKKFIENIKENLIAIRQDIINCLEIIGYEAKEINIFLKIFSDFKINFQLVSSEVGVIDVIREMMINNYDKLKMIPFDGCDKSTKKIINKIKFINNMMLDFNGC